MIRRVPQCRPVSYRPGGPMTRSERVRCLLGVLEDELRVYIAETQGIARDQAMRLIELVQIWAEGMDSRQ